VLSLIIRQQLYYYFLDACFPSTKFDLATVSNSIVFTPTDVNPSGNSPSSNSSNNFLMVPLIAGIDGVFVAVIVIVGILGLLYIRNTI
ncbi:5997_t:CDS:2, partial [Cetraspora pellucida]